MGEKFVQRLRKVFIQLEIGAPPLYTRPMRKFAIVFVLLCAMAHTVMAQHNGVTLDLEIDQQQYLSGEDVRATLTIVNRSGQPLILGATTNWISFDVIGEHEYVAHKLGEMPVKQAFTLMTGQTIVREFNITPYFDFRKPGRYSLRAVVRIPQWKQEMACKPAIFTVEKGTPLTGLGDLAFGVPLPAGVTNAPPDIRRYGLLRVSFLDQMRLYFQLSDGTGRPLRVYPLARIVDFRDPEAEMDRFNHFHVLVQTGARVFTYCEINTSGTLLARQYHEYSESRPRLRLTDDGHVFVGGGRRLLTSNDYPATPGAPSTR